MRIGRGRCLTRPVPRRSTGGGSIRERGGASSAPPRGRLPDVDFALRNQLWKSGAVSVSCGYADHWMPAPSGVLPAISLLRTLLSFLSSSAI